MNIEELNRKHLIEKDMYYRVHKGLSSQLLEYKNGIFKLEIIVKSKWQKNINATALEIANVWKETHPELSMAIGCKVYIVDVKQYPYKQALIHRGIKPGHDNLKGIIFAKHYYN